jgi:hypothetical protein
VCNESGLNHIFEFAGVAYGPCPVPGTSEFTKAAKKRRLDAVGKKSRKCPKVAGKKKVETMKATPSRGKAGLKQPSAAEVASARPLKQSKNTTVPPATVVTHVPTGASGSKAAAIASSSKGVASVEKTVVHIHKCCVPMIGAMTGVSSEESQESMPHGQVAQDSALEIASRLEPHGQSS